MKKIKTSTGFVILCLIQSSVKIMKESEKNSSQAMKWACHSVFLFVFAPKKTNAMKEQVNWLNLKMKQRKKRNNETFSCMEGTTLQTESHLMFLNQSGREIRLCELPRLSLICRSSKEMDESLQFRLVKPFFLFVRMINRHPSSIFFKFTTAWQFFTI